MQIKVNKEEGCIDCPFSFMYNMSPGFGCNAAKEKGIIYENKKTYMPDTPDWCPLKSESITVKMTK